MRLLGPTEDADKHVRALSDGLLPGREEGVARPLAAPFGVFGRRVRGACNDRSRLGESASEPLPRADGGLRRRTSFRACSLSVSSARGLGLAPATLGPSEFRGRRDVGVGMPVAAGIGAGERFGVVVKVGRRDIAIGAAGSCSKFGFNDGQEKVVVGCARCGWIIEGKCVVKRRGNGTLGPVVTRQTWGCTSVWRQSGEDRKSGDWEGWWLETNRCVMGGGKRSRLVFWREKDTETSSR